MRGKGPKVVSHSQVGSKEPLTFFVVNGPGKGEATDEFRDCN